MTPLQVNYAHPDSFREYVGPEDITTESMANFESPHGATPYVQQKPFKTLRADVWSPEILGHKPRSHTTAEMNGISSFIPNRTELAQIAGTERIRQRALDFPTTGVHGWRDHDMPGSRKYANGLYLVQETSNKNTGHTRVMRSVDPLVQNHMLNGPAPDRIAGVAPAMNRLPLELRLPRKRHPILQAMQEPLPSTRLHIRNGAVGRAPVVMGIRPAKRMARNAAYSRYEALAGALVLSDDTSMFREPLPRPGAPTVRAQQTLERPGHFKQRRRDRASCVQTALVGPPELRLGPMVEVLLRQGDRTVPGHTLRAPGLRVIAPRAPMYDRINLHTQRPVRNAELGMYKRRTPHVVREIDPSLYEGRWWIGPRQFAKTEIPEERRVVN